MLASTAADPLTFLRELLADDRRVGMPWSGPDFAQRVHLAVKECGAGSS